MAQKNSNHEIKIFLYSLETMLFKTKHFVEIDKIDVNSHLYDCKYDQNIRRLETVYVDILHEILLMKEIPCQSWYVKNELENTLLSASFYRSLLLYGRSSIPKDYERRFHKALYDDLRILEKSIADECYDRIKETYSNVALPVSKNAFISKLKKMILKKPINKQEKHLPLLQF